MPCPHFDVKIIQRSKRQSAVASAAYQSGERLFSEYDQKQKYYSHKSEIVHTEIMLPPHAPPEYADRNTLWNAAEAIEKQWNSQLARRFVLAIPRELPRSQYADLIRDYCREFFVSKGMIADFAIHDKGDGNPHAHILLTMRAMDETGKWLPKSRKVYDLDENGERIRLPSGNWKSHKEDTVDWNDQKYAEIWRQGWADTANRYLEAIGSPERLDLRSYARQGIDKIPTVHMGPAVSQLEKKGIQRGLPPELRQAVTDTIEAAPPPRSVEEVKAMLEGTEKGGVRNSIHNCLTVFQHDPELSGAVAKNLLTERIDLLKPIGRKRRTGSKAMTDTDMKYIRLYLEDTYGLTSEKKIADATDLVADAKRNLSPPVISTTLTTASMIRMIWQGQLISVLENLVYPTASTIRTER